ncbi:MAG TPA: DUF2177 family protein [Casimicrobiaceae bacterium]|jgi:uncharacterized membrane protein|nr:DUF2177 family protein [Casimicrobiaceae bacterium]
MRRNVAALIACLAVCCGGDFLWLGIAARDFYLSRLGALLRPEPYWLPAALFYALYASGLLVFCVTPALAAASWRKALGLGALLGLIAYATYDLSNLATLQGWPVTVALADVAWGMSLSGVAALSGYAAAVVSMRRSERPGHAAR